MNNATSGQSAGHALARAWKSKGTLLVALVLVGGVGIWLGRWTRSVPEVAARAGTAASSSGVPAAQKFDTLEDPNFKAGVPLRQMDRDIFDALANARLERTALLDLFPEKPYKVRVLGSVVERRYGAVMVDLERDGKWDERWTLKGNEVSRAVPDDPSGGNAPIQYNLSHGRWQVH